MSAAVQETQSTGINSPGLRSSILLVLCFPVLFSGCTKLVTVPVETVGKISCAAISAGGSVAAETVKAAGNVACSAIENPDGAAAATAMLP